MSIRPGFHTAAGRRLADFTLWRLRTPFNEVERAVIPLLATENGGCRIEITITCRLSLLKNQPADALRPACHDCGSIRQIEPGQRLLRQFALAFRTGPFGQIT